MQSSEHMEQVGFVRWVRDRYPGLLVFSIPNGGYRYITTAKMLKAEGLVSGIPDLMIPRWKMFVEMKISTGGRLSIEQQNVISKLENDGYTVIVGKGAEDASRQILDLRRKDESN